jgi:hypothetical protein
MRNLLKASGIAAAIAFAAFAPGAVAQEIHFKQTCHGVGGSNAESLGDREGHSIEVSQLSCLIEGGPMSGGVVTGGDIVEWDKTTGTVVSGDGVIRKPGGFVAYQEAAGRIVLTVTDGKVTGWGGSGKLRWVIATGSAAPLAGKEFNWTIKSGGAGQWEAELATE